MQNPVGNRSSFHLPLKPAGKVILALLLASTLGLMEPKAASLYRCWRKIKLEHDLTVAPALQRTDSSGHVGNLERFSHYVARPMGFTDLEECPQLCKLAYAYLKKSKECDENIYEYLSSQPDAYSLYVKLVEELDRKQISRTS